MTYLKRLLSHPLALILVFALVLRVLFLQSYELLFVNEGDAITRLWQAYEWVQKGNLVSLPAFGWLPGPAFIYSIPIALNFDPVFSSQMIMICIGLISLALYYAVTLEMFEKQTAILSTLLVSSLPLHVQFSTLTMSEVIALTFLLASLLCLLRSLKENDQRTFYLSTFFTFLAVWTRYEAWIFAVIIFPIFFWSESKKIKLSIELLVLNSLGIVLNLVIGLWKYKIFFYGSYVINSFVKNNPQGAVEFWEVVKMFGIAYGVEFFFCLLLLPLTLMKTKKYKVLVIVITGLIIFNAYKIYFHHFPLTTRFFLFYFMIILPFTLSIIKLPYKILSGVVAFCVLTNFFSMRILSEQTQNHATLASGLKETAAWVRTHIDKEEYVIYEGIYPAGNFLILSGRQSRYTYFRDGIFAVKDIDVKNLLKKYRGLYFIQDKTYSHTDLQNFSSTKIFEFKKFRILKLEDK